MTRPAVETGARIVAVILAALGAAFLVGVILTYERTSDLPAFLRGAERILAGETPFGPSEPLHRWLYAPWFALLFVPLTWLPLGYSGVIWQAALAVALILSLWPMMNSKRPAGVLAAVLIGAFGFHSVWAGHFEPLMVCLLVYALPTRWGPLAIGIAASLKVTPIALVVVYAGRGEWKSVMVALATMIVLWIPALGYDVSAWGLPIEHTLSLIGYAPWLWALTGLIALLVAWRLSSTRYAWLCAAVLWLSVMPRLLLYDVSGLAVGATPAGDNTRDQKGTSPLIRSTPSRAGQS